MKLKRIEINNYKSFGENDNLLFVDKVNAIVGKNESGKSNIIDAINEIGIVGLTDISYFKHVNRINRKPVSAKLWFDSYPEEKLKGETVLELNGYNDYSISGALSNHIKNNDYINELFNSIVEMNESNLEFNRNINQTKVDKLIELLSSRETKIFVEPDFFNEFKTTLLSSTVKHKKFMEKMEQLISALETEYCFFPLFTKIKDISLKNSYTLSNIDDDELLERLFDICDINIDETKEMMKSNDAPEVRNFEKRINSNIRKKFLSYFNEFYSQEDVNLEIVINKDELCILIDTSDNYLDFDERSNGLKWYINIFIQLLHMERSNCSSVSNNIILIDEPGVYLHANAQKELYNLFNDLTKNTNQIIYTTHSPFMIDNKELQNVRAIIKDDSGYSHIYNKITTIPTEDKSTFDTITPLVCAIGLDINYNLGPNFKKKNIIVEGISDYLYLNAYFKEKNFSGKNVPNIIPSTGASNVLSIASILFGWGCDFVILLDQDTQGRSVYDSISDKKHPFLDKIIFADGCKIKSEYDYEIEDIFSDDDKEKFGITNEEYSEKKYNFSYITYSSIVNKENQFSKESISNFDKLNLL